MDALEKLVYEANLSAAVLGRPGSDVFMMVPLKGDGTAINPALFDEIHEKQLEFCGVFGLVQGVARCQTQRPEDLGVMLLAVPAFLEYVRESLMPSDGPKADAFSDWLEQLYQLPDTRNEFGPS